ncbi:tripartite tricarboxylate transporter TctB family protein [uncultured Cedecea sp.]|uniref:tripartite tricarboxylate transporter TctB family protein n=1 Tax=uncultured Cedecea sp. TaxID=988762 RepID=UPI00261343FE|nr:tripartite tricarboxylate transporter TctB family protein [uncultured Cedecea sp.]
MNKINTIIGVISITFGLLIIYLSRNMSMFDEYGVPGERFWPFGVALLFIFLGVLQCLNSIVDKMKHAVQNVDLSSTAVTRSYFLSGLVVVYAIGLYYLGFIISSLIFIPIVMWIMNERKIKILVLASVGIVSSVYVFFDIVFNSSLPVSIFLD